MDICVLWVAILVEYVTIGSSLPGACLHFSYNIAFYAQNDAVCTKDSIVLHGHITI